MNYNTAYNKKITGLRGISVILVILFHINEEIFFFGYLGVDIFFLISGYVITLTLHKEFKKNKKISIINFYYRRIKRLFPSLFVCIFITFVTFIFFADLIYFKEISKSALTSIFGFSNIYYILSNQDYFINKLDNPFIHTWSLGIEEQYYLLYPFLLLAIYFLNKFFKIRIFYFVFFLTAVSFVATFLQYPLFDNFYFPLSRFWEILLGCLLFFIKKKKFKSYLQNIFLLSQIMISLILFYLTIYDIQNTILIVNLFVFSIIYFDKNFFNIILKNKFICYIGKISYSIYLYHFPIIVFTLYFFDGQFFYITALIMIFIISFLNYHLIENAFINIKINFSLNKYFSVILTIIILYFLYPLYYNSNQFKSSINKFLYNMEVIAYKYNLNNKNNHKYLKNSTNIENYRFNNIDLRYCSSQRILQKEIYYKNCYINNNTGNLIHVIGDSQAEQIVPMLLKGGDEFDYLITPMVGATFFPYALYDYNDPSFKHKTKINTHYINLISEILNDKKINYNNRIVIIAGRPGFALRNFKFYDSYNNKINFNKLNSYIYKKFDQFITRNSINTDFILIPDIPVPNLTLSDCVKKIKNSNNHINKCKFDISEFIRDRLIIDNIYKKLIYSNSNTFIFDFVNYNCEDNLCNFFYGPHKPIYSRKNHFSIEYSESMAMKFYEFIQQIK